MRRTITTDKEDTSDTASGQSKDRIRKRLLTAVCVILLLGIGFAAGRLFTPQKVIELDHTKRVYGERTVELRSLTGESLEVAYKLLGYPEDTKSNEYIVLVVDATHNYQPLTSPDPRRLAVQVACTQPNDYPDRTGNQKPWSTRIVLATIPTPEPLSFSARDTLQDEWLHNSSQVNKALEFCSDGSLIIRAAKQSFHK